ncbi:MAG: hypothetical protein K1X74_17615 [Pirellulales bacterium]|nr:hypothetical protein [Pirellulales bacterium]
MEGAMVKWRWLAVGVFTLLGGWARPGLAGAETVWFAKMLRTVPVTDAELQTAHAASTNATVQVATGEPMIEDDFSGHVVHEVNVKEGGKPVRKKLEFDYSRLPVAAYGMQLRPEDEANLPSVSKSRILRKVNGNYISLQVRVLRDRSTGAIYLYSKPYAAVGAYEGDSFSQEFAPLMEDSMREVRGLGLFVKAGTKPAAEAFRTFVASTRNTIMELPPDGGQPTFYESYELILVRARVEGEQVTLHCVGTSDGRTVFQYIKAYSPPAAPSDCSMNSTIHFTEYTLAKQSPTKKALLGVKFNTRAAVPVAKVEAYLKSQGIEGTAFENLTEALDALIDGAVQ